MKGTYALCPYAYLTQTRRRCRLWNHPGDDGTLVPGVGDLPLLPLMPTAHKGVERQIIDGQCQGHRSIRHSSRHEDVNDTGQHRTLLWDFRFTINFLMDQAAYAL